MGNDVLHLRKRHIEPGRRVGIRENNSAVLTVILFLHNLEILIQSRLLIGHAEKLRPYRIEGIGDVREKHRLFGVKKSHERHGDHVVGSHPYEDFISIHFIIFGKCVHKNRGCRIRIFSEQIVIHLLKRCAHARRRRIGILIRI